MSDLKERVEAYLALTAKADGSFLTMRSGSVAGGVYFHETHEHPAAIIREQQAEIERLRKDAERLDVLDGLVEAYGTEVHEGNRWTVDGPFSSVRSALDAVIEWEKANGRP